MSPTIHTGSNNLGSRHIGRYNERGIGGEWRSCEWHERSRKGVIAGPALFGVKEECKIEYARMEIRGWRCVIQVSQSDSPRSLWNWSAHKRKTAPSQQRWGGLHFKSQQEGHENGEGKRKLLPERHQARKERTVRMFESQEYPQTSAKRRFSPNKRPLRAAKWLIRGNPWMESPWAWPDRVRA